MTYDKTFLNAGLAPLFLPASDALAALNEAVDRDRHPGRAAVSKVTEIACDRDCVGRCERRAHSSFRHGA
jgi:hypothetical protein